VDSLNEKNIQCDKTGECQRFDNGTGQPPRLLHRVGRLGLILMIAIAAFWTHRNWEFLLRPPASVAMPPAEQLEPSLVQAAVGGNGQWRFAGVPWDVQIEPVPASSIDQALQRKLNDREYSDATLLSEETVLSAVGNFSASRNTDNSAPLLQFGGSDIRGIVRTAMVNRVRRIEAIRIAAPSPTRQDQWSLFSLVPRSESDQSAVPGEAHILALPPGKFTSICERRDAAGRLLVEISRVNFEGHALAAYWESLGWKVTMYDADAARIVRCENGSESVFAFTVSGIDTNELQIVVFRDLNRK
jgi:hypothetical protein